MQETKSWLMTPEELEKERQSFASCYFDEDGQIFQLRHGAGYWLYGVEYHKKRGWLAFEFDENVFDPMNTKQHVAAIRAWKKGEALPPHYFALTPEVVAKVFDNGLRKWGEDWIDEIDLPSAEEALQGTILGELRYG